MYANPWKKNLKSKYYPIETNEVSTRSMKFFILYRGRFIDFLRFSPWKKSKHFFTAKKILVRLIAKSKYFLPRICFKDKLVTCTHSRTPVSHPFPVSAVSKIVPQIISGPAAVYDAAEVIFPNTAPHVCVQCTGRIILMNGLEISRYVFEPLVVPVVKPQSIAPTVLL